MTARPFPLHSELPFFVRGRRNAYSVGGAGASLFFMAGTGAFLLLLVSALGLVLLFVAISRPNKLWGPSGAQIEKY